MNMNGYWSSSLLLILALAGCAGGGETGTGVGTGKQTVHAGVITGFGSVFLNGVEFDTSNTAITLDGAAGAQDGLAVGMVITLRGSVNPDGTTGTASTIVYEDEVEGIVLNPLPAGTRTGTLNVMGRSVIVGADTLLKNVADAGAIAAGNVVEVSGYASGGDDIFATRIELKRTMHAGEEIEVKGVVSSLSGTTFYIGTLPVNYALASLLSNGWYVEVKSTQGIVNGVLQASDVEKLSNSGTRVVDAEDGDEWEGEGMVTSALANGAFQLNGVTIKVTNTTRYENGTSSGLTAGTAVEVEGVVDAEGAVVAKEVKFRETADLQFEGNVESVNPTGGTFTLFGRAITVNSSTVLKDERDELQSFNLAHLAQGDRVRVRAYASGTTLIATQLEREDNSSDPAEITGLLESNPAPYGIGGIPLSFAGCGCTPPVPGQIVEVTGIWSGSAFDVDSVDIDD